MMSEAVIARLKRPMRRKQVERFEALHDVSFEVPWGEAVGIIGRNGAGKSTLLKILTRITAPTTGRVELGGRVGSLLEVGTGFHPELTGRENVFLNGTLLGMRQREIRRRFDEIVAFAGVEQFLDTQVKRYSTGMYIRLAFAVAAHLECEILAVDEVLAVGDAEFQMKCLQKMRDVAQSGRTVLLVSHQLQTVSDLCSSAMFLERGRLVTYGLVDRAMEEYKRSFTRTTPDMMEAAFRPGSGELRFTDAKAIDEMCTPGNDVVVEFGAAANPEVTGSYYVSAHLKNEDGLLIVQCDSRVLGFWLDPAEDVRAELRMHTPWLKPGNYTVDLFLCKTGIMDIWEQACQFQVLPVMPYPHPTSPDGTERGVVFADFVYAQH